MAAKCSTCLSSLAPRSQHRPASVFPASYVEEVSLTPEIVDRLERAAASSDGFPRTSSAFEALIDRDNTTQYAPLVTALGYHFIERGAEEQRARAEDAFGAMMEFDNRRFPQRLAELDEDTFAIWAEVVAATDDPVLLARFHDLLWVVRNSDRPDLHARSACDAYLELGNRQGWHAMERADCLSRALELANAVSDDERRLKVQAEMQRVITVELEADPTSDASGPGVILTLLRCLCDLGTLSRGTLDGLLAQVGERYASDPFIGDSVSDLRERVIDPAKRRELREAQVQSWRDKAAVETGFLRVIHLEHALEIARLHRLESETDSLLRELQEIPEEDLELKEIGAEIELPVDEVEAFVEAFVDADGGWRGSLTRFGNYGPPGGTQEDLDGRIDELMRRSPFQFHVTKVVYGPSRTSLFKAVDDESHRRLARAEQRRLSAHVWSLLAIDVLRAIDERQGAPSLQELTEFFTTDLIPTELAGRIARGVELYWEGLYDESGHMLAPRLEAVVRGFARRAGVPIIREPQGPKPGGVRSLGDLLWALRGAFGEDAWRLYLENLLTDQLGINLRNVVAHGLRAEVDRLDVVLLVHAACYLRLLGTQRHQS